MSNKSIKDFLVARIEHFLEFSVMVTKGDPRTSDNPCIHGKYLSDGCAACIHGYFAQVMQTVANLEFARQERKGSK